MPAVRPYDLIDVLQHLNQTDQDQGALPDNPDEVVNTLVGPAFETLTVSDGTPMLTTASPTVYWGPLHYSNVVLADSPAGYWRLDEASGTVAADSSGNSNTGTYTGGVTLGQAGALVGDSDTAALFNGSTGHVDIADIVAIDGVSTCTIECWVRPVSLAVNQVFAAKWDYPTQGQFSLSADSADQTMVQVAIASSLTDAGTNFGRSPTGVLAAGVWTYIAVVFDGTQTGNANRLKIYVNGSLQVATYGGTIPATLQSAAAPLRLGSWGGTLLNTRNLNGTLDEVAIYPTALSAARVLAHSNRGKQIS